MQDRFLNTGKRQQVVVLVGEIGSHDLPGEQVFDRSQVKKTTPIFKIGQIGGVDLAGPNWSSFPDKVGVVAIVS